jgi:pilus assembly protein CpaB
MSVRNILLAVGVFSLLGSLVLSLFWLRQVRQPVASQPQAVTQAIMVAARALPEGKVLVSEDMTWKDLADREVRAGNLVRGQASPNEFVGAVTRRAFTAGEPLVASELVKADDKQFLAAVLKPGMRAFSIPLDTPQGIGGLLQPGDRVDVILTHSLAGEDAKTRPGQTVAETVLRDARVIAVDQSLTVAAKLEQLRGAIAGQGRLAPKTVTLEVNGQQAEQLAVAEELGRLQLVIRSLATGGAFAGEPARGTWGTDVSPALGELGSRGPLSGIEKNIRVPPARIR